jgi:hypothetical protein
MTASPAARPLAVRAAALRHERKLPRFARPGLAHRFGRANFLRARLRPADPSEKDIKLTQKLGQLQPFIASHRNARANLHLSRQPNTFLAPGHASFQHHGSLPSSGLPEHKWYN